MNKKELKALKKSLKTFFLKEAEGQGQEKLNLNDYTCQELLTAIEEKLNH